MGGRSLVFLGIGLLVVLSGAASAGPIQANPKPTVVQGVQVPDGVHFDPLLADELAPGLPTVAILVVEPSTYAAAKDAIVRARLSHYEYPALAMFAVAMTAADLDEVLAIPGLQTVYRNEHMHTYLDKAAEYVAAPVLWKTYKITGKGMTIMIVDTGVDGTHPDVEFGDNLIENIVSPKSSAALIPGASGLLPRVGTHQSIAATDGDGHGTHVASIAGGRPPSGNKMGIGHGANLLGFQAGVTPPGGGDASFESTTVLDSFDYAIANKDRFKISVVSNSWGANGDFDERSPINVASFNMYKSGLVVTFAAGNEGADGAHTLNRYSTAPWVLAVAAGDYLNKIAPFSSRGTDPADRGLAYDHPDVTAPGVGISAAKATTTNAQIGQTDTQAGGYVTKSGTSMATPVVSGIAALLLEANPKLSPDDVYDILTYTAKPLSGYEVWEQGAGYVNAFDAYKVAKEANGSRESFLKGNLKYGGSATKDPKLERDPVSVGYLQGTSRPVAPGGQTIQQLGETLIGTVNGIVFLIGFAVLALLAFRFGGPR